MRTDSGLSDIHFWRHAPVNWVLVRSPRERSAERRATAGSHGGQDSLKSTAPDANVGRC
jgi:hypothetical protein